MDAKNRIFVPAKHREELGDSFIIARDVRGEHCLKIYSLEGWEEYIAPITKMPRKDSEEILRYLHRNAVQVSPDSQGRVILTPELVQYAGIQKDVVVVGCSSYAEMWAAENYDSMVDAEDPEAIRAALEQFGL